MGPVVVDAGVLQSPGARGRGIGRYALSLASALERVRPDLVARYLLDPDLAPPGPMEALLATGKVAYADTPGAVPPGARALLALWPLDPHRSLARLWPAGARDAGLRLASVVYDLIPALAPERELADLADRRRYRARLLLVAQSDVLLTLSRSTARDCVSLLGVREAAVTRIGAAPDDCFSPASSRDDDVADAVLAARALPGLSGPFVLHPSGSHPRKNNEVLVEAFARLPAAQGGLSLVITGALPASTAVHYAHLAQRFGATGSVFTTGHVDEDTLLALYRRAALVCFPSLAEGYGLPVAEALASGAPVIAADRPPLDELLPAAARFDPSDVAAIARALESALRDAPPRPSSPPARWDDVARAAGAALEALVARDPKPTRRHRQRERLALVSPLPPADTGVAAYSYRLLEALERTGEVELHAFNDGPLPGPGASGRVEPARGAAPAGIPVRRARSLAKVDALIGGFDHVVYAMGNSHHHLGALSMLRRRPGVVIAHDVRLTNLYRHEHGDPGLAPGGLATALRRHYGDTLPSGLGESGAFGVDELERYGLLMAREVIGASDAFLVNSSAARALALGDAGPLLAGRIDVLPFACALPLADAPSFAPGAGATTAGTTAPGGPETGPVVASFGIVDPAKEPETLVRAVAALGLTREGARPRLVFVGPIAETLAERLRALALETGLDDRLVLSGAVAAPDYLAWLARADIAVQLRASFNGEASAAVGECLAAGVPTIVTRIGWLRELPSDAVEHVVPKIRPFELTALLAHLLDDDARRSALAGAARRAAAARTFEASASALLDALRTRARRLDAVS